MTFLVSLVIKLSISVLFAKSEYVVKPIRLFSAHFERTEYLIQIIADKYSLPDWPHSDSSKRQEWLDYRQALRDLPSSTTPQFDSNNNLINVTWPTKPDTETTTTTEETTTTTEMG